MYTPEMLEESNQRIAQYRSEEGNENPVDPGLFIFFCCHEDNATAVEYANERLSKQYNQDFSQMIDKYATAGDPDRCVERPLNISTPARALLFERCIAHELRGTQKVHGARSSSSISKVQGAPFKEPRYGVIETKRR